MAKRGHVRVVKRGYFGITKWVLKHPGEKLNLSDANLSNRYLLYANLRFADLSGANLICADLLGADLSGANLSDANLLGANLIGANLSDAKFTGSELGGTVLVNIDLSVVKGLSEVRHIAPSPISICTVIKSKGQIPREFLEGCGVPDNWIARIPSLLGEMEPIQFYSCFISYSHRDEEFCQRLHSRLRDEKLRVWYAPEDMKGGKKIHEQIDQAIRVHDKLLLVLSEASMASEWVATEISKARAKEKEEKRRVLFPVRLVSFDTIRDWECFDSDIGKDSAKEIREYFIPDFSNWKDHDAFEVAFDRLMSDLRDEVKPQS